MGDMSQFCSSGRFRPFASGLRPLYADETLALAMLHFHPPPIVPMTIRFDMEKLDGSSLSRTVRR
jgi:hypothetical protein